MVPWLNERDGCSLLLGIPLTLAQKIGQPSYDNFRRGDSCQRRESVSPAAILEHAEDAELIEERMNDYPEFREILTLRHQKIILPEIVNAEIPVARMSRLAPPCETANI